ncbi:hypothetical protein Q5752_003101 [Cryptotrichosporon argae]
MPTTPDSAGTSSTGTLPTPVHPDRPFVPTMSMSERRGGGGGGGAYSLFSPTDAYAPTSPDVFTSPPSAEHTMLPPAQHKRRAAPPPIVLATPADADISPPSTPSAPRRPHAHGHAHARGGLNIAGLAFPDEAADALAELVPSPGAGRRAFAAALEQGAGAPASPAWMPMSPPYVSAAAAAARRESLDVPGTSGQGAHGFTHTRNYSYGHAQARGPAFASPFPPPSPLGARAHALAPAGAGTDSPPQGPRRFEPTPQHGLHARNLSLFFPQPGGAAPPPPPPGSAAAAPAGYSLIPTPDKRAGSGMGMGSGTAANGAATPDARGKRRGHHHKHSLSHNFFSFLDPTQTNPALRDAHTPAGTGATAADVAAHAHALAPSNDTPAPVPMPLPLASETLSPLPPPKHDVRMLASAATLQVALGAALWVEGQVGGWRCLAAAGYLVVFDALGIVVSMMARREATRSLKRPYGSLRLTALLSFAQSVFLVFAAVYIAKEAIEQVVLGAEHEHGASSTDERPFPHFLLFFAAVASLIAGLFGNHSTLVDATGPLFLPAWLTSSSSSPSSALPVLSNPYTLSVTLSAALLLAGSFATPPAHLHAFDSASSLGLTALALALSLPPTQAFALVLVQTAPAPAHPQMRALRRAMRDVADDRRVLGLGTMRCWQVAPAKADAPSPALLGSGNPYAHASALDKSPAPSAPMSRRPSSTRSSPSPRPPALALSPRASAYDLAALAAARHTGHTPLVVTLNVHAHPDVSDRDVLELTRFAWTRLSAAVDGRKPGEVTVSVRRGWD